MSSFPWTRVSPRPNGRVDAPTVRASRPDGRSDTNAPAPCAGLASPPPPLASVGPRRRHGVAADTQGFTTLAAPPRPTLRVRSPSVAASLAQQLLGWMVRVGLATIDPARGPGSETAAPWLRVDPASEEARGRQRALQSAFPRLDGAVVDCVAWYMVRRAHAEHALPSATTGLLERGLQRALDRVMAGQGYTQVVRPREAPHLLFLSAPHYDGCLFDPNRPSGGGGQAGFYVGLTRRGQPVAIKGTHQGAAARNSTASSMLPHPTHAVAAGAVDGLGREAHQLRTAADYDVLHLVQHEAFRYLVMPLFCGDLRAHAATLLNLQPAFAEPAAKVAGLFGARYLLYLALATLVPLHENDHIVHQDVKDGNLFVDRDRRRLVLGDFGVSAALGPDGTAPNIGHTERYAAPEQRERHGTVTPATDVFCLGAMVYDLLLQHCAPVRARRAQLPHRKLVAGLMPTTRRVGQLPGEERELFYRALADERPSGDEAATKDGVSLDTRVHFRNMHDSLSDLDRPLAQLLRGMVARAAQARPSAREGLEALAQMGFHPDGAPASLQKMWSVDVPPHAPDVDEQLNKLGDALRAIDAGERALRADAGAPR